MNHFLFNKEIKSYRENGEIKLYTENGETIV